MLDVAENRKAPRVSSMIKPSERRRLIPNHHNSRKIATMKFSAILALALALPSVVDGKPCSYEKHSGRKCKSRSGNNGADEIIMGPSRSECAVLCDRASTNGNNGPCGGYEFHDNTGDSNNRKCELHYTSGSGKGSNAVQRGDRTSEDIDCYIKKDQSCRYRDGDEGDSEFERFNGRADDGPGTTAFNRRMTNARRAQCQAICYADTQSQKCVGFEYSAERNDPDLWCRLYYGGELEEGRKTSDYRLYHR